MHAYQGNLCVPEDPNPSAFTSPEFYNFDIAAVGLGFHHFDDPELAAKRLAERLRPGGVLVILDFLPHGKFDVGTIQFPSWLPFGPPLLLFLPGVKPTIPRRYISLCLYRTAASTPTLAPGVRYSFTDPR